MARAETPLLDRPGLVVVQSAPLFVERKTLPLLYPARRFVPLTARAETSALVEDGGLTGVQLVPLSVERKPPKPEVPTKRSVPLAAKALTLLPNQPEPTADQFVPLSVERKTTLPWAAKRFVPETAKTET